MLVESASMESLRFTSHSLTHTSPSEGYLLTFKDLHSYRKTPPESHFMYLGKKET
jgi:hypothetical protein